MATMYSLFDIDAEMNKLVEEIPSEIDVQGKASQYCRAELQPGPHK